MNEIFLYLKLHGEQLDTTIAAATGISLAEARRHLSELATKGEITACNIIRYVNGEKVEGLSCRIAGHIPFIKPTRIKTKPQLDLY